MGIEIERKFLIDAVAFQATYDAYADADSRVMNAIRHIRQGYLSRGPAVRIRTSETLSGNTKAYLTIKSGAPIAKEFEYEIPVEDAEELLQLCPKILGKTRFKVDFAGHMWEVDGFLDGNWMAEVELKALDESVDLPSWVTKEVTGDKRYSNANIAENGFPE